MTREEFARGWMFLTTQTWGRRFDGTEDPARAQLQFDLYFDRLKFAQPQAWWTTCKRFVGGSSWPALDEIAHSLRQENKKFVLPLPEPQPSDEVDREAQAKAEATLSRILGRPFTFPEPN